MLRFMRSAVASMVAAALAISISGVAVHALGDHGWDLALLARALFGLPFAWVAWISSERRQHSWIDAVVMFRSGTSVALLAVLYFTLQTYSPGDTFTLASMKPLWVAGLGMCFGLARVRWIFWPTALVAVIGVALMDGARFDVGAGFLLLALGIGLLGGFSMFAIDFCKNQSSQFLTLHLTVVMLVIAMVAVLARGHVTEAIHTLSIPNDFLLYGLAGLTGTLYQLFKVRAVKAVGANVASIIALMTTIFAYTIGHLVWREFPTVQGVIGIALASLPCLLMLFGPGLSRPLNRQMAEST